ncbi:TSPAN8 [Acanthosepion pharaonis]|uniref:TSPAN8 n=1 Tax=Acanthosepion pharaonis TaxID=158019 RepID=A0A812D241_ACAPH|nr:TSPAN8 [Sepia pharaonis]
MFIFNFIILICGCFLLGVGIYTRANHNELCITTLGSNLFLPFALTLITVGSIIIVLSFLGCCGAIKEVRCMLATSPLSVSYTRHFPIFDLPSLLSLFRLLNKNNPPPLSFRIHSVHISRFTYPLSLFLSLSLSFSLSFSLFLSLSLSLRSLFSFIYHFSTSLFFYPSLSLAIISLFYLMSSPFSLSFSLSLSLSSASSSITPLILPNFLPLSLATCLSLLFFFNISPPFIHSSDHFFPILERDCWQQFLLAPFLYSFVKPHLGNFICAVISQHSLGIRRYIASITLFVFSFPRNI